MIRFISFPILVLIAILVHGGCSQPTSGSSFCKFVSGRPTPGRGEVRYDATFDVEGTGFEVVLIIDKKEADRFTLSSGIGQSVTLKCAGLLAGEHRFELESVTKHEMHTLQSGVFLVD